MNIIPPSSSSSSASSDDDAIDTAAAQWVLRLDRQLTADEQDAFSAWLAADPRHREVLALHRWGWDELDRLAGLQNTVNALPDPDLLAPRKQKTIFSSRVIRWMTYTSALAAAVAVMVWWARAPDAKPASEETRAAAPTFAATAPIEQRVLEDGSTVELNRGAIIETKFTATERRLNLVHGEANFQVAKNPNRPFIVNAGGIEVRAVGTVFNVRLDRAAVEVLVAEGKVQVKSTTPAGAAPAGEGERAPLVPLLEAGQHAVVALAPGAARAEVTTLSASELEQKTAWQPRLLDFTAEALGDIVNEFNRRNAVHVELGDAELRALRLSATFRSDNVAGFVRLMESDFGMRAEWRSETEIVLRKAQ